MGIGTLIIFIALLLVAAIAAGVLIQTASALQEKALSTGDQAKGQIATNIRVVEVSASNGVNGKLSDFNQIIKLAPGSDPVKLEQTILTVNTYDKTATLSYAGSSATFANEAQGYYTLTNETLAVTGGTYESIVGDFDDDELSENVTGGMSGAMAYLNLSSGVGIQLGNCTGSTWTDRVLANNYVDSVSAVCDSTSNVTSITIYPKWQGRGKFAVDYLQTGSNHVAGNLQRGDVVKLYYYVPRDVGEDEHVRINFIPKIGTPTLTEFITPNVIATERVYLYP